MRLPRIQTPPPFIQCNRKLCTQEGLCSREAIEGGVQPILAQGWGQPTWGPLSL